MLRIAVELGDRDVFVLREATTAATQRTSSSTETRFISANESWLSIEWNQLGLSLDEVESIGSKLQSFGLLGPSSNFSRNQNSFIVLQKAIDFLTYIRSAVSSVPD